MNNLTKILPKNIVSYFITYSPVHLFLSFNHHYDLPCTLPITCTRGKLPKIFILQTNSIPPKNPRENCMEQDINPNTSSIQSLSSLHTCSFPSSYYFFVQAYTFHLPFLVPIPTLPTPSFKFSQQFKLEKKSRDLAKLLPVKRYRENLHQ